MGLSVYDREGPYFTSGEIKWSQLRNTFKEVSSGSISALELKRNTNNDERDPIVPDAVANVDIAGWNFSSGTGDSNWKASQMRDSYKRFWARQTGTDINLRMGRYNGSSGIDWGGYGSSGRDSTSSGNGNLTKNIQKYIKLDVLQTCSKYKNIQNIVQYYMACRTYNLRYFCIFVMAPLTLISRCWDYW